MTPPPEFSAQLLAWYDEAALTLPWRGSRDPYRVCLSEVMLQQTRVAVVEPYYARFLERFPTVQALAAASLDEVLKMWEGLGYYARARNLHRLAQVIVREHDGQFPTSAEALQRLPGIGRYTAAAIASIAFGERVAVLDGNVMRVLARVTDLAEDITQPTAQEQLWQLAEAMLPAERAGDYNQALMDLGRRVCTPRQPACEACPVSAHCLARQHGTVALRPVKAVKAPVQRARAVAAVLRDEDERVLLVQRPPKGLWGGLWTLPGGLCEAEEALPDALQRHVRAALGVEIEVGNQMAATAQTLTHLRLTLRAFDCRIISGKPRALGVAAYNWVSLVDARGFGLGKADRAIIEKLVCWQPRLFEEF